MTIPLLPSRSLLPVSLALGASLVHGAAHAAQEAANPYGLQALWETGDAIARGTLFILLLMSMASWFVLLIRLYESVRLSAEARAVRKSFFMSLDLAQNAGRMKRGSAFRHVAETGIDANRHHADPLSQNIDRTTWVSMGIQRAIDDIQARLQGGLALLATVGSTAPFIGLFGTVWGIYHALTAIGVAGQASIDKVAGPVGEALIMTAIGLAVAVPAVLGYNFLVRRNKLAMDAVRNFGADVHNVLMGATNVARAQP
ncbi:MotA/TolQ/ExbB proton channel family protein [Sphingomonas sp. NCPPB 2930]